MTENWSVSGEQSALLLSKKQQLNTFTQLNNMDAPTKFFFSLESSVARRRQIVCLHLPNGRLTSDQAEIRKHAMALYTDLFRAESCDMDP